MSHYELDLTPLYRHSVGFDQWASLLKNSLRTDSTTSNYPPYNIWLEEENQYKISIAVAGFSRDELDIHVENSVLTVRGKKSEHSEENNRQYLYQGVAGRSFERKFNLADHIEVKDADLENGLLIVSLSMEIPEAMKPKKITIGNNSAIDHKNKEAA